MLTIGQLADRLTKAAELRAKLTMTEQRLQKPELRDEEIKGLKKERDRLREQVAVAEAFTKPIQINPNIKTPLR